MTYEHFKISNTDCTVLDISNLLKSELRSDSVQTFDSKWDETIIAMQKQLRQKPCAYFLTVSPCSSVDSLAPEDRTDGRKDRQKQRTERQTKDSYFKERTVDTTNCVIIKSTKKSFDTADWDRPGHTVRTWEPKSYTKLKRMVTRHQSWNTRFFEREREKHFSLLVIDWKKVLFLLSKVKERRNKKEMAIGGSSKLQKTSL